MSEQILNICQTDRSITVRVGNIGDLDLVRTLRLGIFGGQTFAMQNSTTAPLVSTVSPSTPQNGPVTLTTIGVGTNNASNDFIMLASGQQGTTLTVTSPPG